MQVQLTVNLAKSDFGKACVTYLGHVVGKGRMNPIQAKVEAITNYPMPTSKNQLIRFLGMVGFTASIVKTLQLSLTSDKTPPEEEQFHLGG